MNFLIFKCIIDKKTTFKLSEIANIHPQPCYILWPIHPNLYISLDTS